MNDEIEKTVDLRTCQQGDILITRNGQRLKYLRPLSEHDFYEHEVEYPTIEEYRSNKGTRTHDGHVWRHINSWDSEDIVEIIHI